MLRNRAAAAATAITTGLTVALAAVVVVAGCDKGTGETKGNRPAQEESSKARMAFVVESPAFRAEQPIPARYTADGDNVSPALNWPSPPTGSKEFAILVEDRDAPAPAPADKQPWAHWIVTKIPAAARGIPENVPHAEQLSDPAGAVQGKNSWGQTFYRGPEPPKGSGPHHYIYRVYALDAPLPAPGALDRDGLIKAMEGHILAHGETIGIYERK